jgi:hypothetical protein
MIVVDRIEGERAVLEGGGERFELPASLLPPGTREGDVLTFTRLSPDLSAARARLDRLRARDPGGSGPVDL